MTDTRHLPIQTFAATIAEIKRGVLRRKLNAYALEGYAPLIGTFVPTVDPGADGGIIIYILGSAGAAEAIGEESAPEAPEPEAAPETAEAEAPRALEPTVTVIHTPGQVVIDAPSTLGSNGNGNGAHVNDSHGAIVG